MSDAVLYEVRGDAAWITLNQPERRNALSEELVAGLRAHLASALADDRVRAIVLTGAGAAFCAGADLKSGGLSGADAAAEHPFVTVLKTIWNAPKPVIGRINGHAFGGGLGLTAACDLTLAADTATFAFTEVRIGVVPAVIAVTVLPRLLPRAAHELFLTGETFDAGRAVTIGLVNAAVPAERLDAEVTRYVELLRLGAPDALAATKALMQRPELDSAFAAMQQLSARHFASAEGQEGMAAFAEKRPPNWVPPR